MRHLLFAAMCAVGVLTGSTSAATAGNYDYPYCLQGRIWGYPGLCHFTSYEQCLASASGVDAYCGINPLFTFAQQWQGGRHRHY
jgi:hypothetical protein